MFRLIKAFLLYSKRAHKPLGGLQLCCDAVKLVLTLIWRVDQSESQNGCFLLVKELLPAPR